MLLKHGAATEPILMLYIQNLKLEILKYTMTIEKSRTQKKNEDRAFQKMGEKLVELPKDQLKIIKMPGELLEAVLFAKTTKKHGARRRQMQYIGTIMRSIDIEPVKNALTEIEQNSLLNAKKHQEAEKLRDRLLTGDIALIDDVVKKYPGADRQRLGQMVRSARKEVQKKVPLKKSSRNLFRYLRALMDAKKAS